MIKINFRLKLFLAFVGFSSLLVAFVVLHIRNRVVQLPLFVTRELMLTAVTNAAEQIDAADVRAAQQTGTAAEAAHERLRLAVERIRQAPPYFGERGFGRYFRQGRAFPGEAGTKQAAILLRGQSDIHVVILAGTVRGYDGQEFPVPDRPALRAGWREPSAPMEVLADEQGKYFSAYAPIHAADGAVVGLVAMEARGPYIERSGEGVTRLALIVLGGAVLLSIVPAVYLAWRLHRPVRALRDGMARVAGGDLASRIPPMRTRDEFEDLIAHFNDMTDAVADREKLKASLALAMEIQQQLLPDEAPRLPGFEIAGQSKYCDETGGDYYDFLELTELGPARLGIAVGDVTGHGIAAALLMATARGVLRTGAEHHGQDLSRVLGQINRHLERDTDAGRFMTLFYGILDADAHSLTWASAGHDPGMLYRPATDTFEDLGNTGIPLGVLAGAEFGQNGPVHLAAGDVLLIGTDGIWEAHNDGGEMFGKERLRALIRARHAASAEAIRAAVLEAVADFQRSAPQQDDITLVVVRGV